MLEALFTLEDAGTPTVSPMTVYFPKLKHCSLDKKELAFTSLGFAFVLYILSLSFIHTSTLYSYPCGDSHLHNAHLTASAIVRLRPPPAIQL